MYESTARSYIQIFNTKPVFKDSDWTLKLFQPIKMLKTILYERIFHRTRIACKGGLHVKGDCT